MLGSADRRYESTPGTTIQRDFGFDRVYGAGKVRLRLLGTNGGLGAIGTDYYTLSFNPGATAWATTLWPTPLPAGTGVLKCVLYQVEDMSPPKNEISDIDMRIDLNTPVLGSCGNLGRSITNRVNTSLDNKAWSRSRPRRQPLRADARS